MRIILYEWYKNRFGQEVMLIPKDQEHFTMQARISISPQFYGWLAGLGTGAVIGITGEYPQGLHILFEKDS